MERPNDLIDHHYLALPYYNNQDWSSLYWKEHRLALKEKYYPYVIWRSLAFTGKMLNIDEKGIRRTPSANCAANAKKVYVFGGSAMWGWGAPDWGTIPAYLQNKLQATNKKPVCVVNFGENAYVSTQSLIQLQLLLGEGQVPDLVIFYSGVNEVIAASQSGQTILHQNFTDIAARFQNREYSIVRWFKNFNAFRLFNMLVAQFDSPGNNKDVLQNSDIDELADAVSRIYLNNYRIIRALAEAHQFDYYLFWQPHILIGNKPLNSHEQNMITGLNWVYNMDPALIRLFRATYAIIEREAPNYEHMYYMGYVFDKTESQLWIDTWGHVTPVGNKLVADEMIDIISSKKKM
jgi:lysophospholipase L1-like esterase